MPILAYWLDEAVAWFGAWVEGKLSERDKAGKSKWALDDLLGVRKYHLYGE